MITQKARVEEVKISIPEGLGSVERAIEHYGRVCYRSEDRITADSAEKFVQRLYDRGHHAMLEFCDASVIYVCDRGMSHEQVRHRLASFAQESSRYCNYSKGKFNGQITVIEQPEIEVHPDAKATWTSAMVHAEAFYMRLLELGISPQSARSVLPIGLSTKLAVKANLREWLKIFELRCSSAAHPIIRECSKAVLRELADRVPSIFDESAKRYLK